MKKSTGFIIALAAIVICYEFVIMDNDTAETDSSVSFPDSDAYYMYVASDGLNVRKQPDVDSAIVTVIHQNDKVVTDKVSNGGWYKITVPDESAEGYVNASYLAEKPLTEKEIAAQKEAAQKAAATAAQKQTATRSVNPAADDAAQAGDAESPSVPRVTLTKVPKN